MLNLLVQILALAVLVELFVRCMPRAMRVKSVQNTYRVDGTVSEHRWLRERRAYNRLRRDLLAVLAIVFLTGNALYFALDSTVTINKVAAFASEQMGLPVTTVQTATAQQDFEQVRAYWQMIASGIAIWVVVCVVFVAWGAKRSYRSFSVGVNDRSAEHFQLDMTRMSISGNEFANELLANASSNTASNNEAIQRDADVAERPLST